MAQVRAFSLGGLGAPCCCGGTGHPCKTCSNVGDTLHATESNLGAATLTWDGVSKWVGTSTFAFPGIATFCPPASVPLTWIVDSSTCLLTISWFFTVNTYGCPGSSGSLHSQSYLFTILPVCAPFSTHMHTTAFIFDAYNSITNGATSGTATVTP
jgi:hypothetical protein